MFVQEFSGTDILFLMAVKADALPTQDVATRNQAGSPLRMGCCDKVVQVSHRP